MDKHPFFGENFRVFWLKHFTETSKFYSFKFIEPVKFVKSKIPFLYHNIGRNITNGIYYNLLECETDFKGKTFLIYDVLSDKQNDDFTIGSNLKVRKVTQYKGFKSSYKEAENFDEFFSAQFSSKRRSNLRTYIKRLEANFDITFNIYYGSISKNEYDAIFAKLIKLLDKRFSEQELVNDILVKKEYYYDLFYRMILDKEASFNVLSEGNEPIAICVSFLSSKRLFFAITTFDTDFKRYSLGHILIYKIMEWCFKNNLDTFDFSKGIADYKDKWANDSYDFENHIIYDNRSIISIIVGNYLYLYFSLKQYLRDLSFNKLYSKVKYKFGKKNNNVGHEKFSIHNISEEEFGVVFSDLIKVSISDYGKVKPIIYDEIYIKPQTVKGISIYKFQNEEKFVVKGKKILCKVLFNGEHS